MNESLSVSLRATTSNEIKTIVEMESTDDAIDFLIPRTQNEHLIQMARKGIIYLSICNGSRMIGYMVLAKDPEPMSIECRRIVISESGQGFGTIAMQQMETYCERELGRNRIWLDFFENNHRGRHVYEKLGYREFDRKEYEGRVLILCEKILQGA